MRVAVIKRDLEGALGGAVEELVDALRQRTGYSVEMAPGLVDAGAADAYLLCGSGVPPLAAELADAATRAPERLARTIMIGLPWGFRHGTRRVEAGTAAELLETYRLGGCFAPKALVSWQDAPSWFAGPKELMPELGSNAIKAFQSDNYAAWFAAPGATLEEFLVSYLPVLNSSLKDAREP